MPHHQLPDEFVRLLFIFTAVTVILMSAGTEEEDLEDDDEGLLDMVEKKKAAKENRAQKHQDTKQTK